MGTSVPLEDRVTGDYAFQLAGIGTINHRYQWIIVYEAERGVEREIWIQAGKRLRWKYRAQRVFTFAFAEKALQLV
ncbi:MAG: hypothetical protein WB918_07715, partial [Candidatus Sulfotelmatobacter sp.]